MKKRIVPLLIGILAGLLLLTACGDKEKIKEKLRAVAGAIAERKKAAGSQKEGSEETGKQSDNPESDAFADPSLTAAQRKALDQENPWFARDFRMELTAMTIGSKVNVEIQKSGPVIYYHFWNSSGDAETLILLGEDEFKSYRISTKNKVAQFLSTSNQDYYTFFCSKIGDVYGIVHKPKKEKKKSKSDEAFVESKTQESVNVEDESWGGFDCEKITRVTDTESDMSAGMKALGGLLGGKADMENMMKDLKKIKQTDISWIDKKSGAVVHRSYKMEGGGGMAAMGQMQPQPSVSLLTFSPDPSLIPASLEGYKLVK